MVVILFVGGVCRWIWIDLPNEKTEQFSLIITIISLIGGAIGVYILNNFLCTDLEKLNERIKKRYNDEIVEIDDELKEPRDK